MLKVLTDHVRTLKANSVIEIHQDNLPIVQTIVFGVFSGTIRQEVNSTIASWGVNSLYMRVCISDIQYPHAYAKICTSKTWEKTLDALIVEATKSKHVERYDVIIQPFKSESSSGVIIKNGCLTIVEAVDGNAFTLHRLGRFAIRIVMDGHNTSLERGVQGKSRRWAMDSNGKEEHTILDQADLDIWDARKPLHFRLSDNTMYEFCVYDGEVFFTEKKPIAKNTFFYSNTSNEKAFIVFPEDNKSVNRQYFEYPELSLATSLSNESNAVFTNGAYLSHLSYYASINKYACRFIIV